MVEILRFASESIGNFAVTMFFLLVLYMLITTTASNFKPFLFITNNGTQENKIDE